MKRQVQETGIRKWYGDDWVSAQKEAFKVLDGHFEQYGNLIIKGVEVDGSDLTPGIVGLWGKDDANNDIYKVAVFEGLQGVSSWPVYLVLDSVEEKRLYNTGTQKNVTITYKATAQYSIPSGEYLTINQSGDNKRYLDAIQSSSYRFVTDADKSNWNGKLNASEVVTSPTANKVLKLDGSAKFPASAIAQSSSYRFVTDTEKSTWNGKLDASEVVTTPTANKVLKLDSSEKFPSSAIQVISRGSSFDLSTIVSDQDNVLLTSADYGEGTYLGSIGFGRGGSASHQYRRAAIAAIQGDTNINQIELGFFTTNDSTNESVIYERARITREGNLAIGKTTADERLDVNGNIIADDVIIR